jgi:hypothetical protein
MDLAAAAEKPAHLTLGQRVLTLGVMGRFFGQEVLVSEGLVAGRTQKPRRLFVIRGGLDTDPGLPVFTTGGSVIGVACIQQPEADEISGNPANLIARGRGLVLPVETVAKATQRAREVEARGESPVPATQPTRPEPGEDNADDEGDGADEPR